jgi:hypothetical protein
VKLLVAIVQSAIKAATAAMEMNRNENLEIGHSCKRNGKTHNRPNESPSSILQRINDPLPFFQKS